MKTIKSTFLLVLAFLVLGKLFKSTLNNRLHRNLACVIDKSSRGTKLKRAFEELPKGFGIALPHTPASRI